MTRLFPGILLVFLMGPFARPASAQAADDRRPRFEEGDCPFDTSGLDVERLRCGSLTVPENRRSGSERTLRLAVAVMEAQAPDPAPDPLVFLIGGPGGHALPGNLGFLDALFPDRDVIVFDQRGTGYSEPDMCASLQATSRYIAALDLSEEEAALMTAGALRACRDAMLAAGVDLGAYSVRENAADLDDLRRALRYPQWNLAGISYGAMLAQAALRDHPEGIRSVVLMSPAPIAGLEDLTESTVPTFADVLEELFERCAADAGCRAEYPDLRGAFHETLEALDEDPFAVPADPQRLGRSPYVVNAQDFVNLVHEMLYSEQTQVLIPSTVHAFSRRDSSAARTVLNAVLAAPTGFSEGMYHSAMCYDAPASKADWERAASAYPALRGIGFWNEVCEDWHAARATPGERAPVESEVPVLVLSGDLDPVIARRHVEQILAGLPNAYHVAYPTGAHNPGSRSGRCTAQVIAAFIANPASPLDTSCTSEVPGIEFSIPSSD